MNGAGLTLGSVAGSGAGRGGRIMHAEAGVHNKLAEVWGLWNVTEGGLMRMSWVDWIRGEDVEAFSTIRS